MVETSVFANKAGYFAADDPDRVTMSKYTVSLEYYSQAIKFFQIKNYPKAILLFEKVIKNDPENADAFYYLARCEWESGKKKAAILYYYLSDCIKPRPWIKENADKFKKDLPNEDKKWVDDQLKARLCSTHH